MWALNNTSSDERLSGIQDEPVSSNPSQNKLAMSVANYSGKMSLLNAAVEVLRQNGKPLNTREIVAKAVADGLWNPTGAKTPNQTLYGSIFREIATTKKSAHRQECRKRQIPAWIIILSLTSKSL